MGLFDKKYCSICGEKIGLLGNRKLADGNLCKECARKLSPRFTDRKESTVEEIREQLNYRAENKVRLGSFKPTNTYGIGSEKLYLDAGAGAFVVSSTAPDKGNPDIVTLDMVTGCELDIHESKSEVKYKAHDGRTCSYQPAQYTREFDFYLVISVNHPYFDRIKFQLNNGSIEIEPQFSIVNDPNLRGFRTDNSKSNEKPALISPRVSALPAIEPSALPEYVRFTELGNEIKAKLLRQEYVPASAPQSAPAASGKVVCPYCGAETDAGDTCAFCGAPLN